MNTYGKTNVRGEMSVRGKQFAWGTRTFVMGIVNVTPDSFSGDGCVDTKAAVAHAIEQLERSSDIIDIGGESTRPGHIQIPEATEIDRVVPVIRALRESSDGSIRNAVISIDTYKPSVVHAACQAGADIINSVWGMPDELLDVALEFGAPVVIMHNKAEAYYGSTDNAQRKNQSPGIVEEVIAFLDEAAQRAVRRGIPSKHVILDPGIGFGKTAEHNIAILQALPRLVSLGFPTMLGTSRKSTIGKLTGREPQERLFGTAATTALAIAAGIDIVRVHDVTETRDVIGVADAIVRNWRPVGWIA